VIVRVLGSAAGGGVPQWNCACPHCAAARRGTIPRRSQSSLAVSGDGSAWWLVNVSPDVAQQIEAYEPLQPRETRGTPIAGILVTDANVDHLGGLAVLRQTGAAGFTLWSSGVVREIALGQPAFAPFASEPHRWLVFGDERHDLDARLWARAFAVTGTTPGYDGRRAAAGAVVAIEIGDRASGATVLAAPVFGDVDQPLRAALAGADVAFIDGSFYVEDELASHGVAGKGASRLGHLPVAGPGGARRRLADLAARTRIVYTHLNNTNPLVDSASREARETRDAGFEIAEDGLTLSL
jgi:pyrroloquinoline quinone biosynthesis protein B